MQSYQNAWVKGLENTKGLERERESKSFRVYIMVYVLEFNKWLEVKNYGGKSIGKSRNNQCGDVVQNH